MSRVQRLVSYACGVAQRALRPVKERLLRYHVHEAADVGRGALDRGRGARDDVDRLDDVEVDRHSVAALADSLAHTVDEDVRGLAADAGIGGRAEVGVRVGARRELAELRRVLDVDRVHLGAGDDRHVPGDIDDVVLSAEDGGEGTGRRENLLLDRHIVHVELLHLNGGLRARRIGRGGRCLGRRRGRRRGRGCCRGCGSRCLRQAQWCQGRQRKAGGEPKTIGIVHRFGVCA
jgi:hypothetical protein